MATLPTTISADQAKALGWGTSTTPTPTASKGGLPSVISADEAKSMGWNTSQTPISNQVQQPTGVLGQMQNFSTGVGKGVLSTVKSLGNIGGLIGQKALGAVGIQAPNVYNDQYMQQNPNDATSKLLNKQNLAPQGLAENLGYGGEKVGEFFLPGGAEKGLATKATEVTSKIPSALGMIDEAGNATKIGSNVAKLAQIGTKAGITGLSTAGVTGLQGGNLGQIKTAGIVGGIAGGAGQALETFGKGLSESLQKSGFKLAPMQEAKIGAKADKAAKFMTENNILGSDATKYSKLTALNNNLESTLQSSLPKNVVVPKQAIIDNINSSIESLKTSDPAIYKSAKSDADSAIKLLQSQKGENAFTKGGTISVQDALASKRSYGSAAFKQTKFAVKDPRVVSEGSYAVEQGFQKALTDTLDKTNSTIKIPPILQKTFGGATETTLGEFNKVYSNAITSKNLTNLARFKNDTGLIGRMFGLWAGQAVGQTVAPGLVGKVVGGTIGEMASTRIPGIIRNATERVLPKLPGAVTGGAKVGLGILNQPNQ